MSRNTRVCQSDGDKPDGVRITGVGPVGDRRGGGGNGVSGGRGDCMATAVHVWRPHASPAH